jgi:uncharacterized membrane protein
MKTLVAHWKTAFLTGLAVVLPAAVSIGVLIWLFGTVARFTDTLLLFVPQDWTHSRNGEGPIHLYWSVMALVLAILLVGLVGRLAGYYFGKQLIRLVDLALMRVPLFNKIYHALKQVKEAFTSNRAATFKQVVLVEFPRSGLHSIGFITGAQNGEVQAKTRATLVSVFVPTPPLTSGSIILLPEAEVVKLDMSVADGIKFIMSLGSVSPVYPAYANFLKGGSTDSNRSVVPRNGAAKGTVEPEALTRFEGEGGPELVSRPARAWQRRSRPARTVQFVKQIEPMEQRKP